MCVLLRSIFCTDLICGLGPIWPGQSKNNLASSAFQLSVFRKAIHPRNFSCKFNADPFPITRIAVRKNGILHFEVAIIAKPGISPNQYFYIDRQLQLNKFVSSRFLLNHEDLECTACKMCVEVISYLDLQPDTCVLQHINDGR